MANDQGYGISGYRNVNPGARSNEMRSTDVTTRGTGKTGARLKGRETAGDRVEAYARSNAAESREAGSAARRKLSRIRGRYGRR